MADHQRQQHQPIAEQQQLKRGPERAQTAADGLQQQKHSPSAGSLTCLSSSPDAAEAPMPAIGRLPLEGRGRSAETAITDPIFKRSRGPIMNTRSTTLFATALLAVAGTAGLVISAESAAPKQQIVKLERVVIVGKRANPELQQQQAAIVQLPRVVIEGRRAPDADTQMASAKTCLPQQQQSMC
jgi:hypothetical protein